MQFERDQTHPLFIRARQVCLAQNLREQKSENITSYFAREGGVCYLRIKNGALIIGLFRGAALQAEYPFLIGKGKVLRQWVVTETLDEPLFKALIEKTVVLNIEAEEKRRFRRRSKPISQPDPDA